MTTTTAAPHLDMVRDLADQIIAARGCTLREAVDVICDLLATAPRSMQVGVIHELRQATGHRHLTVVK